MTNEISARITACETKHDGGYMMVAWRFHGGRVTACETTQRDDARPWPLSLEWRVRDPNPYAPAIPCP